MPCGAEQHGGVAVVAAGMHTARIFRSVGQAGVFEDRQRVHVGAQGDGLSRPVLPALDDPDNPGATDAGDDLVAAEIPQFGGDRLGGAEYVLEQFGMLMQVSAPDLNVAGEVGDAVVDWHKTLAECRGGSRRPARRAVN